MRAQAGADGFEALCEFLFEAAVGGAIVFAFDAEIVLRGDSARGIVGVFVIFAVAEALRAGVMRILQMPGNRKQAAFADVAARFADGDGGGVRFRCAGKIGDGLRERELALGQADELAGLHRGDGQRQRVRVGVADIFAGEDYEPAGEESHVLAPFEHAGEPVHAGVGVAAADAFDQCAGGVVMVVARGIVADGFALDGVGDEFAGEVNWCGALAARWCSTPATLWLDRTATSSAPKARRASPSETSARNVSASSSIVALY